MRVVKRLPFAEQIVVLDHDGRLLEQGSFDDLNSTGSYVSSFALGPSELDCKPAKPVASDTPRVQLDPTDKPRDLEDELQGNRSDITIYLYYIRAIGWPSTLVFLTAISGFAFCVSFPSMHCLPRQRSLC